jgi:very-short-patch-repair endonuclease
MTLPEKKLWDELRKLDMNIRRQAPIGRYVADFACHAASLVIEVDGPMHDLPDEQLRDLERTAGLRSQGYQVMRVPNEVALTDSYGVAERVQATILEARSRGKGR